MAGSSAGIGGKALNESSVETGGLCGGQIVRYDDDFFAKMIDVLADLSEEFG